MRWYGNDKNPLAAACIAVNAIVWGLGNHVLVGSSDVIFDPLWHVESARLANGAIDHRNRMVNDARTRVAVEQFAKLTGTTVRLPSPEEIAEATEERDARYTEITQGLRRHAGVPIATR
jgi:hypothetical protein